MAWPSASAKAWARIEGDRPRRGRRDDGGERLPADVVVVGVGITPNTGLAEGAGLDVDNGVVTDARLHTSAEGVWAAGDAASWESTALDTHVRVEHGSTRRWWSGSGSVHGGRQM